jgi:RNA polymerase sigma factor (sigma-70 family)
LTEHDRILLLKQGDVSAFRELVDEFGKKVHHTCLGLLQNTEDAEDISQEVFVSIYESIHSFKGEAKLSTWIYRIALTKSLEYLRMKSRKKRFAFFQQIFSNEQDGLNREAGHFDHPGVQLENKERASILFKAIDQLPENQKSAFVLHKLEGISYAEIAEVMTTSVSSVESLMVRARQNLQKKLGDYYYKHEK